MTDLAGTDGEASEDGTGPSAPGAPTLTASGSTLEVTWAPHADAVTEEVIAYVVEVSGIDPVEVDATTTSHTFADVADGTYLAVVRAVNAHGSSPSSAPSESVTVGTPVAEVVGTVRVEGALTPGGEVTIVGSGYASNIPTLDLELHSTPVALGTVASDAAGGFSASVILPETIEPGEHEIVVLHEGVEVSSTPIQIQPVAGSEVGTEASDDGGPAPSVVGVVLIVVVMAGLAAVLLWQRQRSSKGDGEEGGGEHLTPAGAVPPLDDARSPELQEVP